MEKWYKMTTYNVTIEKNTAGNSTYPKGGVSCSEDSFVVNESSVLRMKFSGKNSALRVAANQILWNFDNLVRRNPLLRKAKNRYRLQL